MAKRQNNKKGIISVSFAIILIMLGLSFFIDIPFNFTLFIAILVFIYAIFNIISKVYLKGIYLLTISIILLDASSLIKINILNNISWSIAIIGITLIYLGIKSLFEK
ncbi:MAG: hypothetical protein ACK5HR_06585 [Mycoplasmatales bacterium]